MPGSDWMTDQRDPVSVWFDPAALQLLERAYRAPGEWTGQYLAPPSVRARRRLALMGTDPLERDRWGEIRWVRAYKRAVYYNLRVHGYSTGIREHQERVAVWPVKSLEWQTGRRVLKAGWPSARWAIRIRLHPTGRSANRAALGIPMRERWIDPASGNATERQSTRADRPWLG